MAIKLNRVIHGDCVKEMAKLDAGCVDLAFADPPFNIGYDYDVYDDKRSCNDYLDWSREWISGVRRVLRPWGAFWLAIGDEYAAELKVMVTSELGFICRSWVVWYYTFGVHCTHKFTRSHTHLFYFVKPEEKQIDGNGRDATTSRKKNTGRNTKTAATKRTRKRITSIPAGLTFNADAIRVPSARQLVYGDKRANAKGRLPDDTWMMTPTLPAEVPTRDGFILRPQDIPDRYPPDSDTWFYPRVAGTFRERRGFHGCQMPEQLLGRIIKACSNEGDVVMDPFSGSGTTVVVAKKLGRQYLGLELSKEYVAESCTRLSKAVVGAPLDGFENPLTSAPNTKNGTIRTKEGKRVKAKQTARRVNDDAQRRMFA